MKRNQSLNPHVLFIAGFAGIAVVGLTLVTLLMFHVGTKWLQIMQLAEIAK